MTKTEHIAQLLRRGLSPQQIAVEIGCRDSYVRAVRQRVNGGGSSPADQRYYLKMKGCIRAKRRLRYWSDDDFRKSLREYNKAWYSRKKQRPLAAGSTERSSG